MLFLRQISTLNTVHMFLICITSLPFSLRSCTACSLFTLFEFRFIYFILFIYLFIYTIWDKM